MRVVGPPRWLGEEFSTNDHSPRIIRWEGVSGEAQGYRAMGEIIFPTIATSRRGQEVAHVPKKEGAINLIGRRGELAKQDENPALWA